MALTSGSRLAEYEILEHPSVRAGWAKSIVPRDTKLGREVAIKGSSRSILHETKNDLRGSSERRGLSCFCESPGHRDPPRLLRI